MGREPHRGVAMKPRDCQEPHVRNSTNCRGRSSAAAFALCSLHNDSRSAGRLSIGGFSCAMVAMILGFGLAAASLLCEPSHDRAVANTVRGQCPRQHCRTGIRGQDRFHARLGQWPDKLCIHYGVARLQHGREASTQDRDSREGGGKDQLNPRVSLSAFARSGKSDVVRSGDGRASAVRRSTCGTPVSEKDRGNEKMDFLRDEKLLRVFLNVSFWRVRTDEVTF